MGESYADWAIGTSIMRTDPEWVALWSLTTLGISADYFLVAYSYPVSAHVRVVMSLAVCLWLADNKYAVQPMANLTLHSLGALPRSPLIHTMILTIGIYPDDFRLSLNLIWSVWTSAVISKSEPDDDLYSVEPRSLWMCLLIFVFTIRASYGKWFCGYGHQTFMNICIFLS